MQRVTPVFWAALALVVPFVVWGALSPASLDGAATAARTFLVDRFGWFYLLTATALLIGVIAVAASPYGRIRLGQDEDRPEYSTGAWFGMLFSAGMGIGLVFWGVAEPVAHFGTPPTAVAGTDEAAREALRYSFFHWGLHPWAIYSVLALAIAYARFRRGGPGTVSAALRPVLGSRTDGWLGKAVDVTAVVATVFGVATSLGLGAIQINGGLATVSDGIGVEVGVQITIIAVVTALFLLSALSGISRGIKWLSVANVALATALFALVLFGSTTNALIGAFTTTLGSYLTELPQMSLQTGPFDAERAAWINGWTVFYWAWWISWSPFVATFIARISRGRTVREFVVGVLAVPTLVSGLWFAVFGGAGILAQRAGTDIAGLGTESQLFGLLATLPLGQVATVAAMVLIMTFFITSADSATFVLGSLTSEAGRDPARPVTVFWGLAISASAAVLLLSGGLQGLQTAAIVAALPFAVVLLVALAALVRALRDDPETLRRREADRPASTVPPRDAADAPAARQADAPAARPAHAPAARPAHAPAARPADAPAARQAHTEPVSSGDGMAAGRST